MKGFPDKNQIDYVFFHLNQALDIHEQISGRFVFLKYSSEIKNFNNKIIFLLSDNDLNVSKIKWIEKIPVLFPLSDESSFYQITNNNLVFTDDILKSSFYLLSGYQEFKLKEKDSFGRFPFKNSIQNTLGIIDLPVVNYYFAEIIQGIELFCKKESIPFRKKKIFENFGFILTHDIDRVDAYSFAEVAWVLKQVVGLTKPQYKWITTLRVFIISFYHYLNIFNPKNPFWNFEFLRRIEKENDFRSVFYILKNEGVLDAKYSWNEKRILNLLEYLIAEGCEIGIHGTMNSSLKIESMQNALTELRQISKQDIVGCRQHFLQFHNPETIIIQQECGIKYDTTLCFAEYEGFRNSYCLPFKIYNFNENRMTDVWEFPLNIMEVTLFGYRNLSFDDARKSVLHLISEIQKFNGILTLLWHNCFFDEDKYKGITNFYENLLSEIKRSNPENILGKELILKLKE